MISTIIAVASIVFEILLIYINQKRIVELTYEQLVVSVVITVLLFFGIMIYKLLRLIDEDEEEQTND